MLSDTWDERNGLPIPRRALLSDAGYPSVEACMNILLNKPLVVLCVPRQVLPPPSSAPVFGYKAVLGDNAFTLTTQKRLQLKGRGSEN